MRWSLYILLLLPATLAAQSGRGDLSGYVRLSGSDNDSLRVTVELTRLGDPEASHRFTSAPGDIYHRYAFRRVQMGEYRVTIAAPGYQAYETTLLIGSDYQGTLAVCLRPPGAKPSRKGPTGCP